MTFFAFCNLGHGHNDFWAFYPLGHFIPLGILSSWAFWPLGHNDFWAFYHIGHFVILGQNVIWALWLWAFCHTWAFCQLGHNIIQSPSSDINYLTFRKHQSLLHTYVFVVLKRTNENGKPAISTYSIVNQKCHSFLTCSYICG